MKRSYYVAAGLAFATFSAGGFADELALHEGLRSVMKSRCVECHNPEKKKGKLDLEHLLANPNNPEKWLDVYEAVEAGDMPPEDEPPLEASQALALLENVPTFEEEKRTRMLTPAEINNSLIDFFKADRSTFNAEGLLSVNYEGESYFTQQHEVMSPYYLEDLYRTLGETVDTLVHARELPKPQTIKALVQSTGHVSKTVKVKGQKGTDLRWKWQGKSAPFGLQYPGMEQPNLLPPGTYNVSFDASTPNFHAKIKEEMAGPYKFLKEDGGFHVAFYVSGSGGLGARHMLKFIKIPVEEKRITVQLDLRRPSKISVAITKGPSGGKFKYNIDKVYGQKGLWKHDTKYPLPCVRIMNVEITGPNSLVETDMTILDDGLTDAEAKRRLSRLQELNLLPVVDDYYETFRFLREEGLSFEDAYRKAIMTFFMSNRFLKIDDTGNAKDRVRFASYALLKSAPTSAFAKEYTAFQQSKNGKRFAELLIKRPSFERFLRNFSEQWLHMEKLTSNPPGKGQFPDYYKQDLKQTFSDETFAFMEHVFRENRPIHELVTADYSFVNPSLHAFYKTGDESSEAIGGKEVVETYGEFEKFRFKDPDRGGLLTQGTFLTVNSNGVEESPIRRATWILENILDRKVPEPSSSVSIEEFEAAKSMPFSKRLDMHRSNPQCNNCHQRIDPIAVVMNSYDTIGRLKADPNTPDLERRIRKIIKNSKGRIPGIPLLESYQVSYDGKTMSKMADLKDYFRTQDKRIARAFCANLVQYVLGRELVVADRAKLDAIVASNTASGLRTVDLYASFLESYFTD